MKIILQYTVCLQNNRYANSQGCRSRPFWLEPEPFFCSAPPPPPAPAPAPTPTPIPTPTPTVNILFLRDPKVILTLIVF